MKLIILVVIKLFYFCSSQDCSPKYILENIIQDRAIFDLSLASSTSSTSTYMFNYPRTFFTSTPSLIMSSDTYNVQSFSQLNWNVNVIVNNGIVTFVFISNNMNWINYQVLFWLVARNDILIGKFQLQNISPNSLKSSDITIPQNFSTFINSKTTQLNFITGIKATSTTNDYEIDVSNIGQSSVGTVFSVNVKSLGNTTITMIQISYAIFNMQLSSFASGGGQIAYNSLNGTAYKELFGSFVPIIYYLTGLSRIRLVKNSEFLLFLTLYDSVLETKSIPSIQQLGITYLSIGQQPSLVCSCDKYIQTSSCAETCPPSSYPYTGFAAGGKTCLTCSALLKKAINQLGTACVCMTGMVAVGDTCEIGANKTICTDNNTVLSNGECVCVTGTQNVSGKCVILCGINSYFNQTLSQCQCNFGYFNITGLCGVCPTDRIYNQTLKACICGQFKLVNLSTNACECIPTFYRLLDTCVSNCPSGSTAINQSCIADPTCPTNQTYINGKCICSQNLYLINGNCSTCPQATFYSNASLSCTNCISNCAVCTSLLTCSLCTTSFAFNIPSNKCQLICAKPNQTLINGSCLCVTGTYNISNQCSTCLNGMYYNTINKACVNCPLNCLLCSNSLSCDKCQTNTTFNSISSFCQPKCSVNQSLIANICQCTPPTYFINGNCSVCLVNEFYSSTLQNCYPCALNCKSCNDPQNCSQCIQNYVYNTDNLLCEPSICRQNQNFLNGTCVCNDLMVRVNGTCQMCIEGQFFNTKLLNCGYCSVNCTKCKDQATCTICAPYFKLVNNECRYNLFNLKPGYPKFISRGIITDFVTSQPSKMKYLSPLEISQIMKIQISNPLINPISTLLFQNPRNINQIRVLHGFSGPLPLSKYNMIYTFMNKDISSKSDIQNVVYDVLEQELSNLMEG